MTPAARVQAAIEILDDALDGAPAEKALTNWARRSRFAGSKDRRAVRDLVYQALRCQRSYAALGGQMDGRGLMIGAIRSAEQDLPEIFSGIGHAPQPLTEQEAALPVTSDPQSEWDLPDWLIPLFQSALQEHALPMAKTLTMRAPIMARVNLRKSDMAAVIERLASESITAIPHPIAATALLVTDGAARLHLSQTYLDGWVEVQDGSSQAAMETINIPENARVLDYCAGGGGKTLALAARSDAQWFAHDALPQRMKDIPERAARAGVEITELDNADVGARGPYDVILCDAPCSGSGTWRRTPQAKWSLTAEDLSEVIELQSQILSDAAQHVAPNGQLIYATCSVLAEENDQQIDRFLAGNPEWQCPTRQSWPVSDGGDGFYVAHLNRVGI